MNQSIKGLIIFALGAAVGSVSTYFAVKGKFEAKADKEIAEVKSVYEDKVNELDPGKDTLSGELKGPEKIELKETVNRLNNKPDLTDYTKYFKKKDDAEALDLKEVIRDAGQEVDPAELERPEDDEAYSDEEDRQQTIDFVDHQLNGASKEAIISDKEPYEIDPSDYELTCANYEKQSLYYYQFDEILADEEEEEVLDKRVLIGDVLESSGFTDDDNDVLYVRNDKIMVDFEITKLYEAFRPSE